MEIGLAIDDFLRYCAVERRLSENTMQAYAGDLSDFRAWLASSSTSLTEVCTDTLKGYLQAIVSERRLATATVRRRMACLRAFFRRLADRDVMADPFSGWRLALPKRKRLPKALSRGEVLSLLGPGIANAGRRGDEDFIAIAVRLMVATGVRVGELCSLRVADLAPDGASLRVHGKGSRDRVAYISDAGFRRELARLVHVRRHEGGPGAPLLVNRHGSKLKPQSVRQKLHRAAAGAGLTRRITPHMLRHTAATLLIETGVDIRIVQRLLGHSSIATTEIYTHVSDEALRTSLERANVLGSFGR